MVAKAVVVLIFTLAALNDAGQIGGSHSRRSIAGSHLHDFFVQNVYFGGKGKPGEMARKLGTTASPTAQPTCSVQIMDSVTAASIVGACRGQAGTCTMPRGASTSGFDIGCSGNNIRVVTTADAVHTIADGTDLALSCGSSGAIISSGSTAGAGAVVRSVACQSSCSASLTGFATASTNLGCSTTSCTIDSDGEPHADGANSLCTGTNVLRFFDSSGTQISSATADVASGDLLIFNCDNGVLAATFYDASANSATTFKNVASVTCAT